MEEFDIKIVFGIIGCGLIGHSIILAIKMRFPSAKILVYDNNKRHVDYVTTTDHDTVFGEISDFVQCDFIFICTPVLYIENYIKILSTVINNSTCTVVDTGSAKSYIVNALATGSYPNFVPGHPMAGGHNSGPELAKAQIIIGRKFILTPTEKTESFHQIRAATLLRYLGATVIEFSPDEHDRVLAITSHLPHLLAYALISLLSSEENESNLLYDALVGRSFLETTIFAQSDAEMWADITIGNSTHLHHSIEKLIIFLTTTQAMARKGDKDSLISIFNKIRERRLMLHEVSDVSKT